MDWLAIVSLVVGIVSIVLAIYSMVTTAKMQKRIVKICKKKLENNFVSSFLFLIYSN